MTFILFCYAYKLDFVDKLKKWKI